MAKYIDADKLKGALLLDQAGAKDTLRTSPHLHPVRKLEITAHIDAISYCVEEINKIPTADVAEVKHGEWITDKTEHIVKTGRKNSTKHISYKCSECGRKVGCNKSFNYCPNCGAKMDGGKAE